MNYTDWIEKGFKPYREPDGNWFGVSMSHPDNWFTKGNKEIHLSLQGVTMPIKFNGIEICEKFLEIAKSRSIKYIAFKEDGKILYQDWFGNLPSEEFLNDYLN